MGHAEVSRSGICQLDVSPVGSAQVAVSPLGIAQVDVSDSGVASPNPRNDAMSVSGGGQSFKDDGGRSGFLTKPAGNSVNLEDQMLKVSANQMDYAAATSLYTRSLGLLKTAIGKR